MHTPDGNYGYAEAPFKRQPSDSDNAPPRGREVISRNLCVRISSSSSDSTSSALTSSRGSVSSRRSHSLRDIISTPIRAISTERRLSEPIKQSSTGRMLAMTSVRSLLVSFQGLPVNKEKPIGLRRKTQVGRSRAERVQSNGSSTVLKEFGMLKADENSRNGIGAKSSFRYDFVGVSAKLGEDCPNSFVNSTAGEMRRRSRGVVTPIRFRDNASQREHKVLDPNSSLSNTTSSRTTGPSPSRALIPSTSNRLEGVTIPSHRSGNGTLRNGNNTLYEYSFLGDIRRRKLRENEIANMHSLRLLYNRLLQWRLANAKVENALLVQTDTAEKSLCNAWIATAKLRRSFGSKRMELQSLRLNLKLYSILKEQEPHLKCWDKLDRDHSDSVSSAINALETSIIRLPVVAGAKADLREVQEAISSAIDITQAMTSPVLSFLSKVEKMRLLVSELSNLSIREHHSLDDCKDLLSTTLVPLQVMHCSLMTYFLQVQQ